MSKWKVLKSKEIFKSKIFRLRSDECELPDGRIMPKYFVFDFLDWVHVIPITKNGEMVTLEQYRHAAGEMFLEIPGGSLDLGEDALAGAQRELLEETGYASSEWIELPLHFPNPALQSNRMRTYLALNCTKVAEPDLDPFEDLTVTLRTVKDVYAQMDAGKIQHSLMIASLALSRSRLLAPASVAR